MKVLMYGAGVIGQVYGGRLAQAGNAVTLASRFTEFPLISADVRQLVAGQGPVPHLEGLLSAADQPSSGPEANRGGDKDD